MTPAQFFTRLRNSVMILLGRLKLFTDCGYLRNVTICHFSKIPKRSKEHNKVVTFKNNLQYLLLSPTHAYSITACSCFC